MGGGGEVAELGHRELAAEQAEAAIGRGDQSFGVDVFQRHGQPLADLGHGFHPAIGDRDGAEDYRGVAKPRQQFGQVVLAMRILQADLMEHQNV